MICASRHFKSEAVMANFPKKTRNSTTADSTRRKEKSNRKRGQFRKRIQKEPRRRLPFEFE